MERRLGELALAAPEVPLAGQQPLAERPLRLAQPIMLDELAILFDQHLLDQLGVVGEHDAFGPKRADTRSPYSRAQRVMVLNWSRPNSFKLPKSHVRGGPGGASVSMFCQHGHDVDPSREITITRASKSWGSRPRHGTQISNPAHLVDIDAKIRARAHQTIRIDSGEAVLGDQPIHQVDGCRLHGQVQRFLGVDGDQASRLLDPHPRDALARFQLESQPHGGLGLGGGAGELGVALARVDIAQVEAGTLVKDRQRRSGCPVRRRGYRGCRPILPGRRGWWSLRGRARRPACR